MKVDARTLIKFYVQLFTCVIFPDDMAFLRNIQVPCSTLRKIHKETELSLTEELTKTSDLHLGLTCVKWKP